MIVVPIVELLAYAIIGLAAFLILGGAAFLMAINLYERVEGWRVNVKAVARGRRNNDFP